MSLMGSPGIFSYVTTKDGKVFISWEGKQVVTLKGPKAQRFLSQATAAVDDEQAQLVMARFTGNFKRGNERRAKRVGKRR